jgi:hypothetical protein
VNSTADRSSQDRVHRFRDVRREGIARDTRQRIFAETFDFQALIGCPYRWSNVEPLVLAPR